MSKVVVQENPAVGAGRITTAPGSGLVQPGARYESDQLWRFRAARGASGGAQVVLVGDSVTQGWAAATYLGTTSWANRLRRGFAFQDGHRPGVYVPMRAYIGVLTSGFETMQGEDYLANTTVLTYTAGGHGAKLDSGEVATHNEMGTKVTVYYCKVSGGGDIVVSVNGNTVATIDTHDASYANPQSGFSQTITFTGTTYDRDIEVSMTPLDADPVYVDGVYWHTYGEKTQVINLGHSGWTFASVTTTRPGTLNFITAQSPDLVIEAMGINNRADAVNTFVTAAEDLADAIDTAAPNASRIKLFPWECEGWAAADHAADERRTRAYVTSLGWMHINLADTLPTTRSGDDGESVLTIDGVHPNGTGHRMIANRLLAILNQDAPAVEDRFDQRVMVPYSWGTVGGFGLMGAPLHSSRSTLNPTAGQLIGVPLFLPSEYTQLTSLAIAVTSLASLGSANAYVGAYSFDGELLREFGTVDMVNESGVRLFTATNNVKLDGPGIILAVGFDGANVAEATVRSMTGGVCVARAYTSVSEPTLPNGLLSASTVSGGLPQSFNWTGSVVSSAPLVWWSGVNT